MHICDFSYSASSKTFFFHSLNRWCIYIFLFMLLFLFWICIKNNWTKEGKSLMKISINLVSFALNLYPIPLFYSINLISLPVYPQRIASFYRNKRLPFRIWETIIWTFKPLIIISNVPLKYSATIRFSFVWDLRFMKIYFSNS